MTNAIVEVSQTNLNTVNSVSCLRTRSPYVVKISWHNVNFNTSPIYVKVKKMNDPLQVFSPHCAMQLGRKKYVLMAVTFAIFTPYLTLMALFKTRRSLDSIFHFLLLNLSLLNSSL